MPQQSLLVDGECLYFLRMSDFRSWMVAEEAVPSRYLLCKPTTQYFMAEGEGVD